jgi:hypothetical protein
MPGKACCATIPVVKETSMPRPQPSHRQPDLFALTASADRRVRADDAVAAVSILLAETLAVVAKAEASDENHA